MGLFLEVSDKTLGFARFVSVQIFRPAIADVVVVRFEFTGVFVIVIASDRATPLERPGFKDDFPLSIAHRDMQPDTAGRIAGRQLVTRLVGHPNVKGQFSGCYTSIADGYGS